jgi:ABC-type lipoprotein export system ATPase subunit
MPVPESSLIINATALCKTYHRDSVAVEALRGVDLTLPAGALAVIFGPSGGGKSTLLHLLGGIDRPTSGTLTVAGVDLSAAREEQLTRFRREKTGFIFQFYNLMPSLSALDNTCLPLLARGEGLRQARDRSSAALAEVGLAHRLRHRPGELSGGEQQRVAIARALVVEPALVLADEPTGDLDSKASAGILELITNLNQSRGITFVIATHNQLVRAAASFLFEMQDGLLTPMLVAL